MTKTTGRSALRRRLAAQLLGDVCTQCGSTDRLEFDHIDPATKLFDISDGFDAAPEVPFYDEVAKCQLLCFAHHRAKSAGEARVRAIGAPLPRSIHVRKSEAGQGPGPKPKLSPDQVDEGALLYRQGKATYADLARRYDVSVSTIWSAVRRKLAESGWQP